MFRKASKRRYAVYLRVVEVAAGAGCSFCLAKGHAFSGGEDRRADLAAITTIVSLMANNGGLNGMFVDCFISLSDLLDDRSRTSSYFK